MAGREGSFKPLFNLSLQLESLGKKDKKEESLKATLEEVEKENALLKEEILKLSEEKENLIKELNSLRELLQKEIEEKDRLLEQVERLKKEKEEVFRLCERLQPQLEEILKEFKQRLYEFVVKALEEFSFSIPQKEALKEDLEKIFSELINYKLPIKLYVNPEDYQALENYLLALKGTLKKEGLELQVITEDKLSPGEILVKSEQFHIERSPKEFAKAVFEEVFRHVFKGN